MRPLSFCIREIYTPYYEKNRNETLLNFYIFGGVTMETKTTVNEIVKNEYVITKDGLRVSYEEYIDMIKSEQPW